MCAARNPLVNNAILVSPMESSLTTNAAIQSTPLPDQLLSPLSNFLLDLNARTVLHMARAVVPHMLGQGSGKIVNIAAFAAQKGAAQMGAYVASKAVVVRITEAMAAELRARGINVNCVMPTIIDTPENRKSMPDADPKQWVAPGDLANVIEFLASERSRAIHGAAIPVTGLV